LRNRIILSKSYQHADLAYFVGVLLCARRERPCRRPAEQRDELAPFHWQYLPCFPSERIAHSARQETAALQDHGLDRSYECRAEPMGSPSQLRLSSKGFVAARNKLNDLAAAMQSAEWLFKKCDPRASRTRHDSVDVRFVQKSFVLSRKFELIILLG
jgi:hypothetical protein